MLSKEKDELLTRTARARRAGTPSNGPSSGPAPSRGTRTGASMPRALASSGGRGRHGI